METEIWKFIENYEGFYQISNLGRVKSLYREFYSGKDMKILRKYPECILKNKVYKKGYLYIALSKKGIVKREKIHRLVANAFIENPLNKEQVDHINTVKNDNRVENLRWATKAENQLNPLTVIKRSKSKMGRLNPMKIKRVVFCQYDLNGKFIQYCYGVKETAKKYGFESSGISRCLTGIYKTAHGFKWSYS